MKLIPDWQWVLRYALSVRYIVLAFVFTVLEVAMPLLGHLPYLPDRVFAALAGLSSALAFYYRFKAQKRKDGDGQDQE